MRNVGHAVLALVGIVAVAIGPSHTRVEGQTATPPILLVLDSASTSPFGPYLAEILRAEGVTAFATAQLSSLTAATLGTYRLALLSDTSLTATQASMFSTYVANGGRLVAMRPDADLHGTLGITSQVGSSTNRPAQGFVSAVINQSGPGAGLQSMSLPVRGPVSHYALAGGTSTVATLSGGGAAGFPAVVRSGRTAAWSFDLARSVAYVRQGDPLDVNLDRDGQPVYRTNDIFYQRIDLQRVNVPHADVHMRLLIRVIDALLADSTPLPRLWYFPGTNRTMLLPTGDSHTSVLAPYTALLSSAQSAGARMSIYLPRWTSVPSNTVNSWRTAGHEVGLHPYFDPDGLENDMAGGYTVARDWWQSIYAFPFSPTARHHSLEWTGWADPASVMSAFGVRMDTSYYAWGPALNNPTQSSQAHGYTNGSGQPMRFVTQTGQVIPVYQQVTALTDEQLITGSYAEGMTVAQAMAVSRQLIDESQAGSYAAIMTQFHVDYYLYGEVGPWADQTMAYAAGLQIPMWTSQRWLQFVEARAATAVSHVQWSAASGSLTFTATLPAGAEPLTMLVPATFNGNTVTALAVDGQSVSAPQLVVNGRTMRALTLSRPSSGAARSVAVLYAVSTPALTIGDITVTEGQAGTTVAGLPVTLSSPSSNTVTVQFQTSNGTATQPGDYQSASGMLTFNPFQTSHVAPVTIVGDQALEANETFSVTLSSPSNATIQDGVGIVTISDDDALPTLTITDVSIAEGHSGTSSATFTVSLSHAVGSSVSVQYATANGTATAGSDFVSGNGTLTFNPGVTSLPLAVAVAGDTAVEPNETFVMNLAAASGAAIGDAQGQGTIVNDDTASGGTITTTFQVQAGGDDVNEEGAAFMPDAATVWVGSGASAATSYAGLRFANVTIPPGAAIAAARLELRSASSQWLTTSFEFAVEASADSAGFSAASRPSQRTLLAPRVQHSSNVQWLAGTWYQLDDVTPLLQAAVNQPGWAPGNAMALIVRGAGANWARKFATAYEGGAAFAPRLVVTYTQGPAPLPTLSVNDVSVTEGHTGATPATFTVSLSASSSLAVTAAYATTGGSATSGTDFTAASGTVTVPAGSTTATFVVNVTGDTMPEPNEVFNVTLTAPTNATVGDSTGAATIVDDDATPVVSVNDVSVAEGNAGQTALTFTVSLSAASSQAVTVNASTASGSAIAGSDFTTLSSVPVSFAPGSTSQPVTVQVHGDTALESNETFTLTLSGPSNASIGDGQGVGTIIDDDGGATTVTVTLQVAAGADDVNESGTTLTATASDGWIGNAASGSVSYAGLRFANVPIPAGATITSARLETQSSGTVWQRMAFQFGMEAVANSPPFTTTSRPSQRALVGPAVSHSSDTQWLVNTWYQLEDIAAVLQAVVNQPGWQAGNAISLILRGTGQPWGRKFVRHFEAGATLAPRLVVAYSVAP